MSLIQPQLLASIVRHWTWADRQRELFRFYLAKDFPQLGEENFGTPEFLTSNMFLAMALWYGLLYATCEGIVDHARQPASVLGPAYAQVRQELCDFRNAMFHALPKYWHPKLRGLIVNDSAEHVESLHRHVGTWLDGQAHSSPDAN
jgi:hypothetical protein